MRIVTTTANETETAKREPIWMIDDNYDDIMENINKAKKRKATTDTLHTPDPKIIFQNKCSSLIDIHSVYNLNQNLNIVKYWQKKYNHLPQIIFITPKVQLNEYNVLKMISSFDLSICRNALAFKHAKAFHLRHPVLEQLYGYKQINETLNVVNFIDAWQKDEEIEFERKMAKVESFNRIYPKEREQEYHGKRLSIKNDDDKKAWYIKQQRKMFLIKWPYDSVPLYGEKKEKTQQRFEKYLKRLPDKIVDFEQKNALPMEVYPLKYLCFWELQKNFKYSKRNCLCNFDYLNKN